MSTIGMRAAVRRALTESGISLLRDPRRFIGYITDLVDTDTPIARMLYIGCDIRYLGLFAAACENRSARELENAASAAEQYLCDEYLMNQTVAHAASWSIAAGCADALRIAFPLSGGGAVAQGAVVQPQPVGRQTTAAAAGYVSAAPRPVGTVGAQVTGGIVAQGRVVGDGNRPNHNTQSTPPASKASQVIAAATRQASVLAKKPASGEGAGAAPQQQNQNKVKSVGSKQASLLAQRPSSATKSIIQANRKSASKKK